MLPDREGLGWLRWVLRAAGISSCWKSSGDMTKCMGKEPGNPEGLQLMAEALQCALGAWLGSIPALGGACSRQGPVWLGPAQGLAVPPGAPALGQGLWWLQPAAETIGEDQGVCWRLARADPS